MTNGEPGGVLLRGGWGLVMFCYFVRKNVNLKWVLARKSELEFGDTFETGDLRHAEYSQCVQRTVVCISKHTGYPLPRVDGMFIVRN